MSEFLQGFLTCYLVGGGCWISYALVMQNKMFPISKYPLNFFISAIVNFLLWPITIIWASIALHKEHNNE